MAKQTCAKANVIFFFGRFVPVHFLFCAIVCIVWAKPIASAAQDSFTNLQQIAHATDSAPPRRGDLHLLVTVCAASEPDSGIVVVQDDTAAELLDLGPQKEALVPGEQILIEQTNCLLRRRETGIQISAAPVVDNDGSHPLRETDGEVMLAAGRHAFTVEWFNAFEHYGLEVKYDGPDMPLHALEASALWRNVNGDSNLVPGIQVDCYEGNWDVLPEFTLLKPVKSGVATNLDLGFRTRDECVALRFHGFFDVPRSGTYGFRVSSDDGAMLFLDKMYPTVKRLGTTSAPPPSKSVIGEAVPPNEESKWVAVEGRVKLIRPTGKGMELELRSGYPALDVRVADRGALDPSTLMNALVRVTGVGRGVLTVEGQTTLGRLSVASAKEIQLITAFDPTNTPGLLTTAEQVQRLRIADAQKGLPVKIRGVVTSATPRYDFGMTLQDGTRGIFVRLDKIPYWVAPAPGEFWEVEGHTGPGNFAPVVMADRLEQVGRGQLPEPAHPLWNELINGSMDVQWVEFQGLVTAVHNNSMTLFLSNGSLEVTIHGEDELTLKRYQGAVVRVRGTLFASWDSATREVRVGSIIVQNASISVDRPAPVDFSDAIPKDIHDLLLFDLQANAFQRVLIRGQIVHAEASGCFLQQGKSGLRIVPTESKFKGFHAGDLVEAVGYPTLAGPAPTLRQAVVRRIGVAPLPAPRFLSEEDLLQDGLDSTLVRVEGKLNGLHREQNAVIFEIQAGAHSFLARLEHGTDLDSFPRPGSRVALTGAYLGQGGERQPGREIESCEILLNFPADIALLVRPPWWTLQRMLVLVGVLLFVLILTVIWITLLRRQVEQRTRQLKSEIREREQAERLRALEAERARIARDLHDDLGSSLAEIAMLSKSRQLPQEGEPAVANLLEAITQRARRLISALDVIVWAVDPEENTLQSLADYFNGFAEEYLSNHGIACRFDIPVEFPPITLDGKLRHDLFLAVKEALHNIVRHSGATEVRFGLELAAGVLKIVICDNGSGFQTSVEHEGHGVKNLSDRLKTLGGACQIDSAIGLGTTITLRLPLVSASAALAHSLNA